MRIASKKEKDQQVVPYALCPAKTWLTRGPAGDIVRPGRTVLDHCLIVANVALALLRRMPSTVQRLYPENAAFAAGCHDIGKVSPHFYELIRRNITPGMHHLPALPDIKDPTLEKRWGGHAGVSEVASKELGANGWVPQILGQHHGISPSVALYRPNEELFGGEVWQNERAKLVDDLRLQSGMDWPVVESMAQARIVAGLTSVSDWIGSGRFFEDPSGVWQDKIEMALDDAGFISPTYRHGLSFEDVFGFQPRAAQAQLIESVRGPGVYILEAPMGMGKTEAALYVAYKMVESGQSSGIYFALPTQLTSNKIHERFEGFLSRILAPECHHRAWLLHGASWLTQTQMGEDARPGSAWFNQSKRGLLAPFAVGTVDQALMAAMRVKHGFVRAFGLAGKVVILDEVHSYDAYTGTILDALVELLRQLGCTVIILSATLNADRIRTLLGRDDIPPANQYPLITANPSPTLRPSASTESTLAGSSVHHYPVEQDPPRTVELKVEAEEGLAFSEALYRARHGQFVLWIENTVKQAQARFQQFKAAPSGVSDPKVGLLHSRFSPADRQVIENEWVGRFGKDGWLSRPEGGCILVGTQILEQSLDLDADFLVSAFAPTDMLLQRIGRLWRHEQTPRATSSRREAWIIAPPLSMAIADPQQAFGPSSFVYSSYVLCRSLQVWEGLQQVSLPSDIRQLIDRTYESRTEEGSMLRWLSELDHGTKGPRAKAGRNQLRGLAALSLAECGRTEPEDRAQTRHVQSETTPTLLLRQLCMDEANRQTRLQLLSGKTLILPWSRSSLDKHQWRDLAVELARHTLTLAAYDAPAPMLLKDASALGLGHVIYLGEPDSEHAQVRLGIVAPDSSVARPWGLPVFDETTRLAQYSPLLGYRAFKIKDQA